MLVCQIVGEKCICVFITKRISLMDEHASSWYACNVCTGIHVDAAQSDDLISNSQTKCFLRICYNRAGFSLRC